MTTPEAIRIPVPSGERYSKPPFWKYAVGMFVVLAVIGSFSVLEWDLSALLDSKERAGALGRIGDFFSSFGAPNLEAAYLQRGIHLAVTTFTTAILGVALAAVLGYFLAIGASRVIIVGTDPAPRPFKNPIEFTFWWLKRGYVEFSRLVLDVFRGVPDFVWAIMIVTIVGPGPVTGVLAIGVSVAGILGKIYSEIWDAIPTRSYASLRSTGAGRFSIFLNGVQPLASRSMLSYTLMRTECAVRNASVIGVVGGGGIGTDLFDEFNFGNYDNVVTLFMIMLLMTAAVDVCSNLLRYQLRSDPNHPRSRRGAGVKSSVIRRLIGGAAVAGTLVFAWFYLRNPFFAEEGKRSDAIGFAGESLDRIYWPWIRKKFGEFLEPDFSGEVIQQALTGSLVPVAIAVIGTVGAVVLAAIMAYPASYGFQVDSSRFTGEYLPRWVKVVRWLNVMVSRGVGLVFRAVPEVAWLWLLASFFRMGILPGVLAMALHSAGVLLRVFTETVDNVPYKKFEQVGSGSRPHSFVYAGVPAAWSDWATYSFFQFESNVRAGLVLGVIGIGGLGFDFRIAFDHFHWHKAATFLLMMILLTVVIDRISRALKISRVTH